MGAGAIALIPLIAAGFLFNLLWYRMRFLLSGSEGQRLFFASAVSGIVLAAIAFPVYHRLFQNSVRVTDFFASYHVPFAGELLLTLVLAVILGLIFNLIEIAQIAILRVFTGQPPLGIFAMVEQIHYRLMRQYSNPLKRLLVDAFERQALVLLSLSSRKVYCGVIFRVTSLMRDEDQFIEIVPMFSAYRNKDSLALEGQLDYQIFHIWRIQQRVAGLEAIIADIPRTDGERAAIDAALEELQQLETVLAQLAARAPEYVEALPINDWVKIIPFSEIETTSIYDEAAYDAWFKMPTSDSTKPGTDL
jgi:hypothetical protein